MDGPGAGGRGRPRACVADLRRGATATARYTLSMKISFRRVDRTNYFRSEFGAIGRPTIGRRVVRRPLQAGEGSCDLETAPASLPLPSAAVSLAAQRACHFPPFPRQI